MREIALQILFGTLFIIGVFLAFFVLLGEMA